MANKANAQVTTTGSTLNEHLRLGCSSISELKNEGNASEFFGQKKDKWSEF